MTAVARDLFVEAVQTHHAGNLDDAARLYAQVLAIHPAHADSLHMLGVLAHQKGRADVAVGAIGQAIALNGLAASYHGDLGHALRALGRLEEAAASYRASLALHPDRIALLHALAETLAGQGNRSAAEACYRRIVDVDPDHPGGHINLGNVLHNQGRLEEAAACYRTALRLNPAYAEGHANLADVLAELGRLDAAAEAYRTALRLKPDFAEALNNFGNLLRRQGQCEEALACFRRVVALKPDLEDIQLNIGNALTDLRQLDAAAACYRDIVRRRPTCAGAHSNLGNVLMAQGLPDAAVASYRQAIALEPDCADARMSLGAALLAGGDLAEGWAEYDWHRKRPEHRDQGPADAQPHWRGEPAAGRTLLMYGEQGFGDVLQFCRYAPLAAAAGFRVIVQVGAPLVRLLRSLDGVALVVPPSPNPPAFDLLCPMLRAPLAFGTQLATIPGQIGYLRADPAAASRWQTRLAGIGGPKVGLCWAGNPRLGKYNLRAIDRRRSMAPALLAPLFDLPGVTFFSLQKEGPPPPEGASIIDYMPEMTDFADTAALVANLDLVIAVDTAVAHLAAALGRPVWLLDRFDHCWRWLRGRRDSPWYPTLRIYRQPVAGDWDSVIAEVAADLARVT